MDHDAAKENWARGANRYCECEPWRYNPRIVRPTEPTCPQHGTATND